MKTKDERFQEEDQREGQMMKESIPTRDSMISTMRQQSRGTQQARSLFNALCSEFYLLK